MTAPSAAPRPRPASDIAQAPTSIPYTQLFIDGTFVDALSGKTFETRDPRSGDVIVRVAEAHSEDIDAAVRAARKAFDEGPWPRMSGYERSRALYKWADLIEQHTEELAALESLDNGKPFLKSKMEVPGTCRILRAAAGWGDKITGNTFKLNGPYHAFSIYEPFGVVGAIIPWNFPLKMFMMKAAPALVAGNTLVLKPAEQTPLTALYLAALSKEAGLPPGVLNVLPGFGESAGAAIANHMDIDKVAFTGSTQVGKYIMEAAAKSNLKPVTLELGGKSPLIICNDADLDQAVELAHFASFYNMGQCCVAGSRTFVQEGIRDEFLKRVTERSKKTVVGDPFRSDVEQGPQVDLNQFNRILSYIESGKEEGATLLTGGNKIGTKGYYIEPTVFADVKDHMKIAREEIFGPVMSILTFKTLEEVIKRANDTQYGLAAGIITKDLNVANTLSRSIRAGTVWINCFLVLDSSMPFGGYKMSGIGREFGLNGVLNYMQLKSIVTPLKDSPWL